jgi:hypothetical protein
MVVDRNASIRLPETKLLPLPGSLEVVRAFFFSMLDLHKHCNPEVRAWRGSANASWPDPQRERPQALHCLQKVLQVEPSGSTRRRSPFRHLSKAPLQA